jgi:CDP-diacylglycerol--serine O-phosphatidyltransferase
MVSFGVAPAIIVYQYGLFVLGKFGWLAAFIYVAAVALRLARFNTQLNKVEKRYFQGLSSTAGAGLIAGLIWVAKDFAITRNFTVSIILAVITVFTGVLMVSNIRYRSFKDADLKHHVPFVVILGAVLIIVLVSLDPSQILAAIFSLYALSGPVGTIWSLRKKKKARSLLKIQGKKNS